MPEYTGGQALVAALEREGVDTLFGLPGVQLDWAYDALYAARDRIRVYHTRHEQATAYMADGYARTTGRVGVCMVVPGPGVLNASAALATAYACSSPVLCIAGQIAADAIDRAFGLLHEVPQQGAILRAITKYTGRALSPAEIPTQVHAAFGALRSGRPRPAAVEIPADVLQATAAVTVPDAAPAVRADAGPDAVQQAAAALRRAERPVIYSGGGILLAEAWDELRAVAELLDAPVIMSTNGRGALSQRHPLAHTGLTGMHLLPDADVILAVGTRFGQPALIWDVPAGAQVIRIDADADEVHRHRPPAIGIVADAKRALAALRDALDGTPKRPSRAAEMRALRENAEAQLRAIQPQAAFAAAIRAALPDDGIAAVDLTQVGFFMTIGFPIYTPRTFLGPGYQGTLGSTFSTALGAQVGNPTKKVVAVMGDGGFLYQVQELATMRQQGINVVAVVFNDNAYGNVKRTQQQDFGGHVLASDLVNPDFMALARAFGIHGTRVHEPDALRGALVEAFAANAPALIEVPVGAMPSAWHLVAPGGGAYPVLLPARG